MIGNELIGLRGELGQVGAEKECPFAKIPNEPSMESGYSTKGWVGGKYPVEKAAYVFHGLRFGIHVLEFEVLIADGIPNQSPGLTIVCEPHPFGFEPTYCVGKMVAF